jgi:hypothetical protein|tara:strand:- start:51362 stop:52024 length:663 start_codon:yes stop_codon:yes gene_type:complete
MFNAKRVGFGKDVYGWTHHAEIMSVLGQLSDEGWRLSLREIFDARVEGVASGLATGFTHDHDFSGIFEAPDAHAAMIGTVRLEQAGWRRGFATEWLIGLKEFEPVLGKGMSIDHQWAFLALWDWNDQWCEASAKERTDYDLECDIAFRDDLDLGVNIAGRYRLDWSHRFHHLGAWEIAHPDVADAAIRGHERVADFKFTTSRHIVGRVTPMAELLLPDRT